MAPPLRRLRSPTALSALLASGLLVLGACSPAGDPAPPPPPAVETALVEPDGSGGGLTVSGALERQREMNLSFRVGGVMTALTVDAGDPVSSGQVLARIDPAAVNARVTQASADLERARRDLRRDETLFNQGYISTQRLEDRRTAVTAAQAAYDAAAFDGRWSRLIAPASGVVLERLAQAGEVVQPGQTVLRIADLSSPLVLRVPVADRDISRVAIGQEVRAVIDSLPGEALAGRVVRVGQGADPRTGAVAVEIEVPGRPDLRSGLTAKAVFPASGGVQDVVRAPAEAVIEASGQSAYVFRLKGDRVTRTQVVFLGFDGDHARLRGLAPGDRVVTAGGGFLSDGERVRIADASALSGALK
ncbi:MAG: efflux RND transporter periplasmic adaptor subunit [Phenylobacterium sp.]|uniref:efflux RND transporter periplasmic adaptor subunit n=1 Tax=Phenylobacterium sp. TaxID=1871053 RepID=UPI0025D48C6C|nr:efflux RND transporter periplasmic adaptor subunit [Phenylobacterium sp.]MCA3756336.1 efflux RND transporter periplasmic adaptor subunit [Phenylobacterium sp.]